MDGTKGRGLYRRATGFIPGGVNSNARAWGDETVFVARGKGSHIWDVDGNEFIDLRMGYGPVIVGHADDRIDSYVCERMREGVTFGLTTEDEVAAAESLCAATGWVESLRMTTSGTEATLHAMRVARGYTGRERIIKFEGQYHGVNDYGLISVTPNDIACLGPRSSPSPYPWGRGIPRPVANTVIPLPFNDIQAVTRAYERCGDEIAAVIVEPILGNAGALNPDPGFLEGLRAVTQAYGSLLIFDEVKTGFRIGLGGAVSQFGVRPDLATFAKAIANGYAAAAFGGRRDVMAVLPDAVSHHGTYAGNRVAASAVVATISRLQDGRLLDRVLQTGERLQAELSRVLSRRGVPHCFTGHPSMFCLLFTDAAPADYRGWAAINHDLYRRVALGMRQHGVFPEPDAREPWFLSAAHSDEDVQRIAESFATSLDAALQATGPASHG